MGFFFLYGYGAPLAAIKIKNGKTWCVLTLAVAENDEAKNCGNCTNFSRSLVVFI